jgi:RHS repeat-associated protein
MNLNQRNKVVCSNIWLFFLFFWTLNVKQAFAQTASVPYQRDYVAKAPNAATFNKYGDIDVSLFTGSPNINLPIYTTRDVDNPISLSLHYNATGIKPEQHHDWVGSNWNLTTGGSITRIKHGDYDERKTNKILTVVLSTSYIDNCWRLNKSWGTDGSELVYKKLGRTNDSATIRTAYADLEPDEFSFNFQGHSGSIMLNHEGVWVFRTNSGEPMKLKSLKPIIAENFLIGRPNYSTHTGQTIVANPRVIIGFVLVTNDGTEYQFGGSYASVEFTYSLQPGNAGTEIWPNTWHLIKIKPISGQEISFTYEKYQFQIVTNLSRSINDVTLNGRLISGNRSGTMGYSLVDPCYLATIATPYEDIRFEREQLTGFANYDLSIAPDGIGGWQTYDVQPSLARWFKLNAIKVYNKNEASTPYKSFRFEYAASASNRLQLTKVSQVSSLNTAEQISLATFAYDNTKALCPYNDVSNKTDAWGYLNNKTCDFASETNYAASRKPDANSMGAEILQKVTYPTGGSTEFVFEPHDYQAMVKKTNSTLTNNPTEIVSLSTKEIAGGLRIKEIKNFDGTRTSSKKYFYVKSYDVTGTESSGILDGEPLFYDKIDNVLLDGRTPAKFSFLQEQSLNPINLTEGSPVAYSEVVEKSEDGSYSIHKYSNHDNADYRNRTSLSYASSFPPGVAIPRVFTDPMIDMKALRGKLLSVKKFNPSNVVVAKTTFDYSMDMNAAKAVRAVFGMSKSWYNYTNVSGVATNLYEIRASSYYIHTTPVLLAKKTEYLYEASTAGSEIKVETAYTYDSFNHLIQEGVTSIDAASNKTTNYKYPYDAAVSETVVGTKQQMIDAFMIGIPLESTTNFGDGIKAEFKKFDDKILPYIFYKRTKTGTFIEKGRILAYGLYNLPTEIQILGYPKEVYTWNNGLLLSKTAGTPNTTTALTWKFSYKTGYQSRSLDVITDENGLRTKFTYDGYQRLSKSQNRFSGSDASPQEVQATTQYDYLYKDANNTCNTIRTTANFINVANNLVSDAYMDGLGQAVGGTKQNYTPENNHLKTVMTYDLLGRPEKSYLPFAATVIGCQDAPTGTLFVKTEYEISPLGRPIKQTNVDNTTILTSYGTNVAKEVWFFTGNNGTSVGSGVYYPANSLYKTTITDENGKQTIVFKDKLGRVVLTRKFLNGDKVDTYNAYNTTGQLMAVLPPGVVDTTYGWFDRSNETVFYYTYDNTGRLIEKQVPGSAVHRFYYDARDLLVLTQDGNMRNTDSQKHLATQYDELGRVMKTGFVTLSPTAGQDVNVSTIVITDADRLTETHYYDNKSWVRDQGAKVLKNAGTSTPTDFLWSYIERREGLTYTGNPIWTGKQHLLASNVSKNPILDNDVDGVDWSITGLNGAGQPTLTIRYLFGGAGVRQVRTYENYAYDNGGRMTDHKYLYRVDAGSLSAPTFTLANMVYNYKDQLIEKNIGYRGMNNALQSIDYSYNLRGWLTDINGASAKSGGSIVLQPILTPSMKGTSGIMQLAVTPFVGAALQSQTEMLPSMLDNNIDLFSQTLTYNYPDIRTGAAPQYNGNISSTTWQVAGRTKQAYGFAYDELNRLTEATSFDVTETNTNGSWSSTFSTDNKFKEKLSYDLRGNISTLTRNGLNNGSWTENGYTAATYGLIDNLLYAYERGNRLSQVTDFSLPDKGFKYKNTRLSSRDPDYRYDANGNLTFDRHKYITSIEYNHLNLPMRIKIDNPVTRFAGGTIEFVYDAMGVKLKKMVFDNFGNKVGEYDYVNGVEYKNCILQRIAHSEGAVVLNENAGYEHQYVLRDHLGNTRVTFRDGISKGEAGYDVNWNWVDPNANNPTYNDGVVTKEDIMQINHYYPFGLNMEGDWNGAFGKNKYQYNGKEWNDDWGLGLNDYGARFYDPALTRWTTVDPMSEKMRRHSPYNYCFDNPVRFTDPDGQAPEDNIYRNKVGDIVAINRTAARVDNFYTVANNGQVRYDGQRSLINTNADQAVARLSPANRNAVFNRANLSKETGDRAALGTEGTAFRQGSAETSKAQQQLNAPVAGGTFTAGAAGTLPAAVTGNIVQNGVSTPFLGQVDAGGGAGLQSISATTPSQSGFADPRITTTVLPTPTAQGVFDSTTNVNGSLNPNMSITVDGPSGTTARVPLTDNAGNVTPVRPSEYGAGARPWTVDRSQNNN